MSTAAARATTAAGPVLVVGASLAGATAAAALREAGYAGPLTMLGEEATLPYERPALSKTYLSGATSAEALIMHSARFYAEQGIALRLGAAAVALDVERRRVRLATGEQVDYGTLVVATGAGNVRPRIPGIDLHGVHQLRTLADADALRASLRGARTAVVVGMGFIGCEVTATLRGLDLAVTAVDALPGPLWGPLGPVLSGVARRWHEQHGVRVLAEQSVTAFLPDATGTAVAAVALAGGERLAADLVVVGVGVRPNTGWLADTGLRLVAGAVGVDVEGRTDLPGVYAAGDVTATWDQASGTHRRHEHWSSAIAQARRAARHIAGAAPEPYAPPYFWSDQYDKTLQYSGEHDPDSQLVLRGDPTHPEQPLSGFFLSGEELIAVLAVNDGRQFRRAQRLLGGTPDPADLADPTVDLRRLGQPTPTPAAAP